MPNLSDSTLFGIRCAADIIKSSANIVVLSGAGISTASGIPDFRSSNNGIWTNFDPFEVASLSSFRYNPLRFFGWLRGLANTMYQALPNAAHISLARLEQAGKLQAIITQNIDSLHTRAGSRTVYEVHGSMSTMTCTKCYKSVDSTPFTEPYLERGEIPHCPSCHSILKPDLVLMGEQLPAQTWQKAHQVAKSCDLMIVVGSSLEVLPVAGLPMRALENGAHLILVNRSQTYLDVRADVVLHDDLVDVLPGIVDLVLDG